MPPSLYDDAIAKLETLYALIPDVACRGLCVAACGPLALSHLERTRLERRTGRKLRDVQAYACPLLKQGRCSVYAIRPAICRSYAAAENMICPYRCEPERYLTVSEQEQLLRLVEEVSQAVYPGKPTVSLHAGTTIQAAQEAAASNLTQVLWGVA
jgi:Fe-S-cluster containining protein